MDGLPLADVPREVMRGWLDDPDFAPEGGETLNELQVRVWAACADLVEESRHHEVVVVTHATPIRAALAWALGVEVTAAWRCHVDQASITRVVFRVLIDSTDGRHTWSTIGVNENVILAAWTALEDSLVYGLLHADD